MRDKWKNYLLHIFCRDLTIRKKVLVFLPSYQILFHILELKYFIKSFASKMGDRLWFMMWFILSFKMVLCKILYIHINWLESQSKSLPLVSRIFLKGFISMISNRNYWDFTSLLRNGPGSPLKLPFMYITHFRFTICGSHSAEEYHPLFTPSSRHQNR